MGSKDPVLLLRLQAAYENGERQRASVKRWMMDNYDDLTAKFEEMFPNNRINWIWLTAWLQENGFRNGNGSDLKKDTVQKVWRRVVEEKAKLPPVVREEQSVSRSVPQASQTEAGEVGELSGSERAQRGNALMLAEMDKRSGRG